MPALPNPARFVRSVLPVIGITCVAGTIGVAAATPTPERGTPPAATPVSRQATPMATEGLTAADFAIVSNAITIRLTADGFSPRAFQYAVGHAVDATLINSDNQPHTFTIDELDIDVTVPAGATRQVTIPPAAYGDYPYRSTAPGDDGPAWEGLMRVFL